MRPSNRRRVKFPSPVRNLSSGSGKHQGHAYGLSAFPTFGKLNGRVIRPVQVPPSWAISIGTMAASRARNSTAGFPISTFTSIMCRSARQRAKPFIFWTACSITKRSWRSRSCLPILLVPATISSRCSPRSARFCSPPSDKCLNNQYLHSYLRVYAVQVGMDLTARHGFAK